MPATIDHVVVLMMENRSFDHLLGFLDHPDPRFPRLIGNEAIAGHKVSSAAYYKIASPDHSHAGVMAQLFAGETPPAGWKPAPPYPMTGTNRGFIADYRKHCGKERPEAVMRCFHPEMIPVISALARDYAVCTQWFCSVPGETWPNRDFAVAARSFGHANQHYGVRSTADTIFHRLSDAGASWRIYHDAVAHTWLYPGLYGRGGFAGMKRFFEDVDREDLPRYSFIEPDYGIGSTNWFARYSGFTKKFGDTRGNSHHPGQASSMAEFVAGEHLIAGIYNELARTMEKHPGREHESLFARTLFVITYDEHGGFFDRERPPAAHQPTPADVTDDGFRFDILGPRVPALLISPWIAKGRLVDTVFDHSSIPATLRKLFAPNGRALTHRDENAHTFDGVLTGTLRTPHSADPIRLVRPLERHEAEEVAERRSASPNPADLQDAQFRQDWLWLARKANEMKGNHLVLPSLETTDDKDADEQQRMSEDDFARKVTESMYDA